MIDSTTDAGTDAGTQRVLDAINARDTEDLLVWLDERQNTESLLVQAEDGYTALMVAAEQDHQVLARLLIGAIQQHSSDDVPRYINLCNADRLTALHFAIDIGSYPIASLLVDKGAEINKQDTNGHSPLHNAVDINRGALVRLLIDHGANVHLEDNGCNIDGDCTYDDGDTPLHIALQRKDCCSEVVQLLINAGSDLNQVDCSGTFPLEEACMNGNHELGRILLFHGANPHLTMPCGGTMLHEFIVDYEMVEWLLLEGLDINSVDGEGITPLGKFLDYLVGRNINKEDENFPSIVDQLRFLLNHGASPPDKIDESLPDEMKEILREARSNIAKANTNTNTNTVPISSRNYPGLFICGGETKVDEDLSDAHPGLKRRRSDDSW